MNISKTLCLGAIALCAGLTTQPRDAHAAFGRKGTVVPSGSISFRQHKLEEVTTKTLSVAPKLQYFISRNFSVGGEFTYATRSRTRASDATTLGLGANAGYNIPMSRGVSFYPQFALVYGKHTVEDSQSSTKKTQMVIDAPFLFHKGNFFLGIGPYLARDLSSTAINNKGVEADLETGSEFGARSVIGGWF